MILMMIMEVKEALRKMKLVKLGLDRVREEVWRTRKAAIIYIYRFSLILDTIR